MERDIAASLARQSAFYAENDRTIPAGPDSPDEEMVEVTLDIDNYYDGDKIRTVVETEIPAPPEDKDGDEYQDWEYDHVFEHTGTGRTDGDSCYFVTVTKSSRPDLIPVGTEYEFGT